MRKLLAGRYRFTRSHSIKDVTTVFFDMVNVANFNHLDNF